MSDMDIRGVFAVGFVSVLLICIGLLIKKFKLAEMVAGYNVVKHEKHKEMIAKYAGNLMLYNGLFAFAVLAGNAMLKIISMSMLSHIVFGVMVLSIIVLSVFLNIRINKSDKNENKNR